MTAMLARLGPTHVFALLGTTRARARRAGPGGAERESYEAVDYGLTALLLRAAVACGSRPRFVYLSSLGARAEGGNAYLRARGRLERELEASGLPYLIARPAIITGADREESRPMERIAAVALDAALGVAGAAGAKALRARYRSMTGAQLAAGLVRLALDTPADARVVADAAALRG